MNDKYGFVYVWRDKKRNMYYVGCHWGSEDDGYVCSSTRMRNVYKRRKEDFKRRIVHRVYTNRKELLVEEHKWLAQIKDDELGKKFYNHSKKHFGHWSATDNAEEIKSLMNKKPWTSERRLAASERMKEQQKDFRLIPRKKGMPKSDAHRKAISEAKIGYKFSTEAKLNMSESRKRYYQRIRNG